MKERWRRLYPMYAYAMISYIILLILSCRPDAIHGVIQMLQYIFQTIVGSWQQIFMLQAWGEQPSILFNPSCWYVAALFWVSGILFFAMKYIPRKYLMWLLLFGSLFILGVYCWKIGHLDFWELHRGITINGNHISLCADSIARGLAEMSLGILVFLFLCPFYPIHGPG